jgi:hypothetical protein
MSKTVVKCAECELESTIDIRTTNVQSLAVPQEEMKRKCKLANTPNFNFNCQHFYNAIRDATLPSQSKR